MKPIFVILICLFSVSTYAQTGSKMKFGKVSKEEFAINSFNDDTSAHAIILTEIGSSQFESEGNWFKLIYRVHRRIKIIDKFGLDEARHKLTLYRGGEKDEELLNLKASTYNLVNNEIVETPMDSKSVFTEKVDKDFTNKRFALPNVKEGSIIEYSYTISSPYFHHLRSWRFQGQYPRLWSEYKVAIPEYFDYIQVQQGFEKFEVKTREVSRQTFSFQDKSSAGIMTNQTYTASPTVGKYTWALKDVPSIHHENFITTLDNYFSQIEFQLSAINLPDRDKKPTESTWPELMKSLLEDKDMGACLKEDNYFLTSKVKELTAKSTDEEGMARNIYQWVRDNFVVTGDDKIWTNQSLKTTFNSKKGNVTEINLLLTAMLLNAGFNAHPLVLSTRDNGYVFQQYPLYTHFNYTIVGLYYADKYVLLDAATPWLGFGKLPVECYNGGARRVDATGEMVMLSADSLFEQTITSATVTAIEDGQLKGFIFQKPSYFSSIDLREKVASIGKEKFLEKYNKEHNGIVASEMQFEELDSLEVPLMINYQFKTNFDNNADLIYFNPVMIDRQQKNPFMAMERKFPVEMPFVNDELYTLNLTIPDDYEVDELPKSARATLSDKDGSFEYLISQFENRIQFKFRLQLKKAYFEPDEYTALRSFFDLVIKKLNEQIVLKKKK
ncbi:DUF3857 domain-containing protein [Chitinophaga silvatica]|uniref:DUF3857 domain-containing protein n=1 Tax=Chitinophaga silvatica TaxID=2282649 RepID=A0A3E1YGT6_9BACT|nr:DUF3858 domain-containing protein [Chitinophaga silvatica]RFS26420.1 DUF3857 domain-containing protein [Chitinophaga silvatica]